MNVPQQLKQAQENAWLQIVAQMQQPSCRNDSAPKASTRAEVRFRLLRYPLPYPHCELQDAPMLERHSAESTVQHQEAEVSEASSPPHLEARTRSAIWTLTRLLFERNQLEPFGTFQTSQERTYLCVCVCVLLMLLLLLL